MIEIRIEKIDLYEGREEQLSALAKAGWEFVSGLGPAMTEVSVPREDPGRAHIRVEQVVKVWMVFQKESDPLSK